DKNAKGSGSAAVPSAQVVDSQSATSMTDKQTRTSKMNSVKHKQIASEVFRVAARLRAMENEDNNSSDGNANHEVSTVKYESHRVESGSNAKATAVKVQRAAQGVTTCPLPPVANHQSSLDDKQQPISKSSTAA